MDCEDCSRLGADGRWHRLSAPDGDSGGSTFEAAALTLYQGCLDTLISKNRDYSPLNISGSPFGVLEGLLTRLWDKQARAVNLVKLGGQANHESLTDTFCDAANYNLIAAMCIAGTWPGVGPGAVKL